MSQNFLSKFAISYVGIPATPEEDYIGGKTEWRDGKLRTYDWGSSSTVYIAHYDEEMPVYDQETQEPTGEMKLATRAMQITVPNPVTREKLLDQARKDIYELNSVNDELNFAQDILNNYMSNPDSEKIKTYEEVTRWINWQLDIWEGVSVSSAKAKVLQEISDYDSSTEVNQFYLGKLPLWLSKETRVGLVNSITIEQKAQLAEGVEVPMTSLWYNNFKVELPCDAALQMLSALELYALQCYNVTAGHKAAVEALDDIEEILNYDYTTGYPQKPVFNM